MRQVLVVKERLLDGASGVVPRRRVVRPKHGAIQRVVLRVLAESEVPLHVQEVHRLVDERLGGVSRDTVRSCLTEGVRLKRFGLERVAYGTYWLDSDGIQA
jgi:hypothetical protein